MQYEISNNDLRDLFCARRDSIALRRLTDELNKLNKTIENYLDGNRDGQLVFAGVLQKGGYRGPSNTHGKQQAAPRRSVDLRPVGMRKDGTPAKARRQGCNCEECRDWKDDKSPVDGQRTGKEGAKARRGH